MRGFLLICILVLTGCNDTKPLPYQHPQGIKPGPGVFSGKKGEFVLYQGDPFQEQRAE